jgi:hypothetical protein
VVACIWFLVLEWSDVQRHKAFEWSLYIEIEALCKHNIGASCHAVTAGQPHLDDPISAKANIDDPRPSYTSLDDPTPTHTKPRRSNPGRIAIVEMK